jgi:hypothetical protein
MPPIGAIGKPGAPGWGQHRCRAILERADERTVGGQQGSTAMAGMQRRANGKDAIAGLRRAIANEGTLDRNRLQRLGRDNAESVGSAVSKKRMGSNSSQH